MTTVDKATAWDAVAAKNGEVALVQAKLDRMTLRIVALAQRLERMHAWGRLAHKTGAWMHVGRVNSARRIALCHAAGAASFDGSGPSRFAVALPGLDNALRQPDLLTGH